MTVHVSEIAEFKIPPIVNLVMEDMNKAIPILNKQISEGLFMKEQYKNGFQASAPTEEAYSNRMEVLEVNNYYCPLCKEQLQLTRTNNGHMYEHSNNIRRSNSEPWLCANNGKYFYELNKLRSSD